MSRMLHGYRLLKARLLRRSDPIVLMYHRVDEMQCDPWRLAVHPKHFAEQIDVLTKFRAVVPLSWLARELEAGRLPRKCACLTFDDGYVDVLQNAKPVLDRFDAPATVFLTTGLIGKRREFWWDRLARILLQTQQLPKKLTIEGAGHRHEWILGSEADDRSDRNRFHLEVWMVLRLLPDPVRDDVLTTLANWAGHPPAARASDRALDPSEVATLAEPNFIDIGAHSVTHPSLPSLTTERQCEEIRDSRAACAALVRRSVDAFAYPFGEYDDSTVRIAADCGVRYACATEPRAALSPRDLFRIPRLTVEDWDGAEFERRLQIGPRAFPGWDS